MDNAIRDNPSGRDQAKDNQRSRVGVEREPAGVTGPEAGKAQPPPEPEADGPVRRETGSHEDLQHEWGRTEGHGESQQSRSVQGPAEHHGSTQPENLTLPRKV